jgi:AraC-like DNA-binding protein
MPPKPSTARISERGARPDKQIAQSFADLNYLANVRPVPRPFMQFVSGHFAANTVTRTHSHPCIALHGCLQGPLVLCTSQGEVPLDAGLFCLLAPGMKHHWRNPAAQSGSTIGLLLDAKHPGRWPAGAGVEDCCRKLSRLVTGVHRFSVTGDDELQHSFWLAADHLTAVAPRESIATVGTLLTLIGQCAARLEGHNEQPAPANDVAQEIRRLLLARVCDRLSINDIAKQLSVSPTRAKEAFRKAFGSGIISYHNQLKIWQAKRLLCDLSLTVDQVSHKLGFSTPSYFGQVFLRYTGETPKQFRRSNGG